MEHENTIPSTLGPSTRPGGLGRLPAREADATEKPLLMKLAFLAAVGLLAFGAVKFFAR